jgi:hypothetical protein
MGLADASEVPPFFYLSDTDRPVSFETLFDGPVRATRHDLTIADVIARLGPRNPAWPDTPRVFRVVFVLLYDPNQELPVEDVTAVARYARILKDRFAIATGHRALIDSFFAEEKPRRRTVRK